MSSFQTKRGKHGTLTLYEVRYRCSLDEASCIFTYRAWAYDAEHAEDRFWDGPVDDPDWIVLSVQKCKVVAA